MATANINRGRRARLRFRTLVRWLSYYETDSISRDETLLRAIPNTLDHFNEDMGNWKVAPYAFKPNRKRDVDGMSFFREDFSTPRRVARNSRHESGARVARITAQQLVDITLAAEPEPIASEPAGHSIVPGMKFVESSLLSKAERRRQKDLSQQLAQFASNHRIYSPRGLKDPDRQPPSSSSGN